MDAATHAAHQHHVAVSQDHVHQSHVVLHVAHHSTMIKVAATKSNLYAKACKALQAGDIIPCLWFSANGSYLSVSSK